MIRVQLPAHLRNLAHVTGEVQLAVDGTPTIGSVLDALEATHPVLRGAVRDHGSLERRSFVRYYVQQQDWSHEPADTPLPDAIVVGDEPFRIIGAMAGG